MGRENYDVSWVEINTQKYKLSEDGSCASFDGYVFCIGNVIPFTNTRSKTAFAKIESFKRIDSGKIWFTGTNIATGRSIYYAFHLSVEILNGFKATTSAGVTDTGKGICGFINPVTLDYCLSSANPYIKTEGE